MRSVIVFWLSLLAAALAVFTSAFWVEGVTRDSEGWHTMLFMVMIVPTVGGGTLLFCLIPSAFFYFKGRSRRDLTNVWISSLVVGIIVIEALLMEPLRHHLLFGLR